MNLYSVYDSKMERYLPPFTAVNNAHAVRMFSDHVNDPQGPVYLHPGDYSLDYVGTMDEITGRIDGNPARVIDATSLARDDNRNVTAIKKAAP